MKHEHTRRTDWDAQWPEPPFHLVLVEPEIAGNAGAIARLAAATGSVLHMVEPLGFRLTDRHLRRAGLDYWDAVDLRRHPSFDAFAAAVRPARCWLFSTAGRTPYTAARFAPGDALVFGSESRGLPRALLDGQPDRVLGIPIRAGAVRSLNLAQAAAIALYEALRQAGTPPAERF